MKYVKVARTDKIVPGRPATLRVGIRHVAVFNVEGEFYAIEDACRHMKAPLSTGRMTGTRLTCSWHGWQYEVTTGACVDKDWACVRTFPVKVENGDVLVSDEPNPLPERDGPDDTDDVPTPVLRWGSSSLMSLVSSSPAGKRPGSMAETRRCFRSDKDLERQRSSASWQSSPAGSPGESWSAPTASRTLACR